jgi:hypothetical protein
MKGRLLLTITMILVFSMVQAQEFKKFLVGLGAGVPIANVGESDAMIYIEPMFRIRDRWSVGGKFEVGLFDRHISMEGFYIRSYTLNTRYYVAGNRMFRPFAEVGGGIYAFDKANIKPGSNVLISREVSGFYPELGADVGHFFFSVAYNYIPPQAGSDFSYVGLCIGGTIGGGKK